MKFFFDGTSIVVQIKPPSREIVKKTIRDGREPHYVVAYGDLLKRNPAVLCRNPIPAE